MDEIDVKQKMADAVSLPTELSELLGNLGTGRGEFKKDIRMYAWDAVKNCTGPTCPSYRYCAEHEVGKRCTIMENYLSAIYSTILRSAKKQNSKDLEVKLLRVGFDLIPLYKNYMFLKLGEMGVEEAIEKDHRGIKRINPIYKEIRETVKEIEKTWKSIGLGEFAGVGTPLSKKGVRPEPAPEEEYTMQLQQKSKSQIQQVPQIPRRVRKKTRRRKVSHVK
jgi:hypothetical protein